MMSWLVLKTVLKTLISGCVSRRVQHQRETTRVELGKGPDASEPINAAMTVEAAGSG